MSLCPFFNEECKGNQCVMWSDGECLVVGFLYQLKTGFLSEPDADTFSMEEPMIRFERPEPEIPDDIKNSSPESLAAEYIAFIETEFPDSDMGHRYGNFDLFLQTKNLTDRWQLPADIKIKIEKARTLAREEIRKRAETERKLRLETEREELPSLVNRCCDWAITNGMKRVTVADVDAFILENEYDIIKETRRALYAMTNVQLKSKK